MNVSTALKVKIQSDRAAAMRLEKAVSGAKKETEKTIKNMGLGAERLSWYTSCLVPSYQDVCKELASEDSRLVKSIFNALKRPDVIKDMLVIYFSYEISKLKSEEEKHKFSTKEKIVKIDIRAAKILSDYANRRLATEMAAASLSTIVINSVNFKTTAFNAINRNSIWIVRIANVYGYAQKSSESARRLNLWHPEYYDLLYRNGLEMLYFIIEPTLKNSIQSSFGIRGEDRFIKIIEPLLK